jgi:uncharacterized membrane protein
MRRFANYFLRGLVFVAPLGLTIYVSYRIFMAIDGVLRQWLSLPAGVGFVITVALITLVGFLASNLLTRGLMAMLDSVFDRLPVVRHLYSSTRDFLNAFVGDRRRFDKPVLVTLIPGGGAKALGFVTQETLDHFGIADHVGVYFPQSYNFAGSLVLVPAAHVERLNADPASVMAFIVSGGVTELPTAKTVR